ncbi:MAG: c-type cytochrome [Legionellales bacterium]|nr:c-type cytochrome [Legionellales bacterium]
MPTKKHRVILLTTLSIFCASFSASAEKTGEEVFKSTCIACHTAGMSKAPSAHQWDNWTPFIGIVLSKNNQPNATLDVKKIDDYATQLLPYAKEGKSLMPEKGVMPPKGTCVSCSDAELKAAIVFMLTPNKP